MKLHTMASSKLELSSNIRILDRGSFEYFAAVLLFLPLIFQRIFVGEADGVYGGSQLSFVGYVSHFILVAMLFFRKKIVSSNISLFVLMFVYFISILQLYNSFYLYELENYGLLLTTIRALLWITAIYVYCTLFYNPDFMLKAFLDVMTFAAIIALLFYSIYFLLDIPLGVNIDRGIGRLQGTFSEPSALSAIYPGYVIANLRIKNYKLAILGFTVVVLSFSVICFATMGIAIFIYLFYRRNRIIAAISYATTLLIVLVTFSAGSGAEDSAYRFSESLRNFVNLFWADGPLRQNTVDRLIDALAALSTYVTSGQRLEVGDSGSLARFVGTFFLIENMQRDGTTWIGYGLSNYGFIADQLYGTVLDFGFFPYLVSSFGVGLGIVAIFIHLRRILTWNGKHDALFLIFICSYFGTIYNSASGILAYTLPVLGLVASYAHAKRLDHQLPVMPRS